MIDTWLCTTDTDLLAAWCAAQDNVLGPVTAGGMAYACIRSDQELSLPAAFIQLMPLEGRAILGDWA